MQDESAPSPRPESKASAPSVGDRGGRPRGIKGFKATDASLLGLGTQMLSEVVAGILLGLGADYMLGTHNRWIVVGSIGGVVVAMWTVIRTTIRMSKRDAIDRAQRAIAREASGHPPTNAASTDEPGRSSGGADAKQPGSDR